MMSLSRKLLRVIGERSRRSMTAMLRLSSVLHSRCWRSRRRGRRSAGDLRGSGEDSGSFDRSRPFAPWLFGIAHNYCIDELRRRKVRPQTVLEDVDNPVLSDIPDDVDVGETAILAEQRAAVRTALERLPDEQRQALQLAYFGGLTQQEIAARLGNPPRHSQDTNAARVTEVAVAVRGTGVGRRMIEQGHIDDVVEARALDALPLDEQLRVDQHVEVCPTCKQLLAEMTETAHLLAWLSGLSGHRATAKAASCSVLSARHF